MSVYHSHVLLNLLNIISWGRDIKGKKKYILNVVMLHIKLKGKKYRLTQKQKF